MKILQLGKFYPIRGGVEKVMFDLMKGISEKGIGCDMLCASETFNDIIVSINPQATLYATSSFTKLFGTMMSPSLIFKLRNICNEYDLIHVHHPDPMAALALWLSGYRGKVILHWHSDIIKQKKLLKLLMPLQNYIIRRADIIVGTTPVYVKKSPHLSAFQDKVTYLPIGIEQLRPNNTRIAQIREKYKGKKIVFSLGRLVEYKGYQYLIDSAKYLPDNYIILIGGSGPLKEKLLKQIEESGLSDKVKLVGRISDDELPAYYAACDLFCLSSIIKTEAFAIVQIEAMSLGKPVVATNIPDSGVSWVNADGVSGLNVNVKDSRALATAIKNILNDESLYKKLSDGAFERFKQLFTINKMIDSCIDIYNSVLTEQ